MTALLAKIFELLQKAYYRNLYAEYRKKYELARSFRFNGHGIEFYGDGRIRAGEDSYIGRYSQIQAAGGRTVTIGNRVSISHFVKVYTQTHDPRDREQTVGGDVVFEDGVWIGAGVFVREGVTIGENSVIGANSVVTKDVPPNTIAGGVPCQVIESMTS
ncbi:MAG TPA: acyltransferase [Thermoguttaceae bacterium]|nr:acyltransferase [Thermoguttaceae bacterium]